MKKLLKEFKDFAFKGNVLDMAVGVMIGGAFAKIVSSVVNDIFMPIISLLTGGIDFTNLFIALDGEKYATLAKAQEAGAATISYGNFITYIIDFLLMALCIFLVLKLIVKLKRPQPAEAEKVIRKCPYCFGEIADEATKCMHCTSDLPTVNNESEE